MDDRLQTLRDPLRLLVAQPLQLVRGAGRYDLRDASGEHLLAAVDDPGRARARADAAGSSWLLAVERDRSGWRIVAREAGSGEPAACYYPGALPGGRIWVAPDSWGRLRRTHLRYDLSWGLKFDGEDEILRVWPAPDPLPDSYDIVVGPAAIEPPQLSLLLIPLVCWIVMSETPIIDEVL